MRASVERGRAAAVWAAWAAMLVGALVLVARYSSNVPSWDDWDMVPTLTGVQPVTAEWLWSQHNEHRIFLPRLVYLAVLKFANNNFCAGAYFNALFLSGFAVALCALVRRLRGHLRYTDAFFPLLLLQWAKRRI